MSGNIKFVSKEDVKGKTIILRVDLNSSVKDGQILKSPKVVAHSDTIYHLSKKGAKLVVLSHQGRKGEPSFINLQPHRQAMEELTGRKIEFFTWDQDYLEAIKNMKDGNVMMLDNTRFLDFETEKKEPNEHAKNDTLRALAEVADMFVLDAFSVAHRKHATVVGFTALLPSYAGPVMEKELKALERLNRTQEDTVLVLGGTKPDDSIAIINKMLSEEKVQKVLLGGILGEIGVVAKGQPLGAKDEFLKKRGIDKAIDSMKGLLEEYNDHISIPVDLAVERYGRRVEISLAELPCKHMIYDIGEITANEYERWIKNANFVIYNGPFGRFEDYKFAYGTRKILNALTESRGFSLAGGGDTVTAMLRLGFKEKEFSHVSLAGKALLSYLAGEELPGLNALAST